MGFELFEVGGRRYGRFPRLSTAAGLRHAFSTRPADMSPKKQAVAAENAERRAEAVRDAGFAEPARAVACLQVHEPRVAVVDGADAGRLLADTDGVCTAARALPLLTFSADCPLVLGYDAAVRVVGMAHASWRCTVAGIAGRLVEAMVRCGAAAGRLECGIGPSAGPEAYEVQDDVYEAARGLPMREALFRRDGARMTFDLWRANTEALVAAGVGRERIEVAGICTMTRTDVFFSYRREGVGCGNFALVAGVEEV